MGESVFARTFPFILTAYPEGHILFFEMKLIPSAAKTALSLFSTHNLNFYLQVYASFPSHPQKSLHSGETGGSSKRLTP